MAEQPQASVKGRIRARLPFILPSVGQEGADFGGAHPSLRSGHRFGGVAFVMEENEVTHPVYVGLFGAVRIMF